MGLDKKLNRAEPRDSQSDLLESVDVMEESKKKIFS
jgi:hypothetical protein